MYQFWKIENYEFELSFIGIDMKFVRNFVETRPVVSNLKHARIETERRLFL